MPDKKRKYGDYVKELSTGKFQGVARFRQPDGKYKVKKKTFITKTEARRWVLSELSKDDPLQNIPNLSFAELCEWYQAEYLHEPIYESKQRIAGVANYKKDRQRLKRIRDFFGSVKVKNFDNLCIRQWEKKRRDKDRVSLASRNRDFSLLKTMFRRAKENKLVEHIPNFPINLSAEVSRERVISFDEEKRLLSVCIGERSHLKDIIIILVDTALRKNELLSLLWSDIDLHNRILNIKAWNTKTQIARIVPMTDRVFEIFFRLHEHQESKKVFEIKDFKRSFATALKLAGLDDIHVHDLRRTAITRMVSQGSPHTLIMKISGHTNFKTFAGVYVRPNVADLTGVASKLSALVSDIQEIESLN
jgi:integrase